jgi:hypothetical protein
LRDPQILGILASLKFVFPIDLPSSELKQQRSRSLAHHDLPSQRPAARPAVEPHDRYISRTAKLEACGLGLIGVAKRTRGDDSSDPLAKVAVLPNPATWHSPQVDF